MTDILTTEIKKKRKKAAIPRKTLERETLVLKNLNDPSIRTDKEAVIRAGYSEKTAKYHSTEVINRAKNRPELRYLINKIIPPEKVLKTIASCLDATFDSRSGKVLQNYDVQLRAADLGAKLHNMYDQAKVQVNVTNVEFGF